MCVTPCCGALRKTQIMSINKIVTVLLVCTLAGCRIKQMDKTKSLEVKTNKLHSSNEIDFEIIKEWVKDKTIVSLGESSHGIGEFYSLKSKVVQYLHNELGFEVLVLEAGMGDIHLAWNDISNLNPSELRKKTIYGNFSCTEVAPLFNYIKEKSESDNPLFYAGFDTQLSGKYFRSTIDSVCRQLKLDIDVKEEFAYYSKMFQASFEADSTNFSNYKDRYLNTLSTIRKAVEHNSSSLQETMKWSELDYKIILRNLDILYQSVNYYYANKFTSDNIHQAFVLRDKFMSENLKWMVENLYSNKKIIIWGHNGHIQKGKANQQETKWMGQHLKDVFGNKYFSIGLFAYQGKGYQHWTKESINFENSDSTSIEYKMKRDNLKYTFQKFENKNANNWVNNELTAFEIESGGIVYFTPSERFDAAICIDRVDIPTFENKE